jgi:GTPase SAR1 family protein
LTPDLAQKLKRLIEDPSFQTALAKRNTFQLQDCWQSFADQLVKDYPAWGGELWVPSVSDCVSVRVRTSGIVEEQFIIDKIVFNVFDVGGQRAERRKWIHSFDNVTAVIFVTAISEYDQVLFEDRNKNRLEEALELFEEICNSRWFLKNPLMLFLNKKDLFEQKFLIEKVPLNVSGKFPTAPDTNDDLKRAIDWITSQFLKKRKSPDKDIYTHVTTATDPHNVRAVFDVCRNVILKKSLANSGFVLDGKS